MQGTVSSVARRIRTAGFHSDHRHQLAGRTRRQCAAGLPGRCTLSSESRMCYPVNLQMMTAHMQNRRVNVLNMTSVPASRDGAYGLRRSADNEAVPEMLEGLHRW